jgi:hypothetical protein
MSRTSVVAILTTAALLTAHSSLAQPQAAAQGQSGKPDTKVVEQNIDANGDIRVHDSGTVAVKGTLDPVQVSAFGTFATGSRFSDSGLVLYTVPAGKVLVVDTLTTSSNMAAVDHMLDANFQLSLNGEFFNLYVQPAAEGVFTSTSAAIFRGTQKVTGYAGPGSQVKVTATRDGASLSSTAVFFALAGHLIDAPQ